MARWGLSRYSTVASTVPEAPSEPSTMHRLVGARDVGRRHRVVLDLDRHAGHLGDRPRQRDVQALGLGWLWASPSVTGTRTLPAGTMWSIENDQGDHGHSRPR